MISNIFNSISQYLGFFAECQAPHTDEEPRATLFSSVWNWVDTQASVFGLRGRVSTLGDSLSSLSNRVEESVMYLFGYSAAERAEHKIQNLLGKEEALDAREMEQLRPLLEEEAFRNLFFHFTDAVQQYRTDRLERLDRNVSDVDLEKLDTIIKLYTGLQMYVASNHAQKYAFVNRFLGEFFEHAVISNLQVHTDTACEILYSSAEKMPSGVKRYRGNVLRMQRDVKQLKCRDKEYREKILEGYIPRSARVSILEKSSWHSIQKAEDGTLLSGVRVISFYNVKSKRENRVEVFVNFEGYSREKLQKILTSNQFDSAPFQKEILLGLEYALLTLSNSS